MGNRLVGAVAPRYVAITVTVEPSPAIDLSVVVATAHPSPDYDRLLEVLLPQLAGVSGELVLVDGTPDGLPTPAQPGITVTHLHDPGGDVFAMRAQGLARARGWVVALTEDHCVPAEGWCLGILEAHRTHGSVAAVSGATDNGTTKTLWDRASYLLTFAPVMPPLIGDDARRLPPPANVSIKQEVLAEHREQSAAPGFLEFDLMPHLYRSGHVALANGIEVSHFQGNTARWFVVHHFHNGRATGGLVDRGSGVVILARRAWASLALVPRHVAHTAREIWRRPTQRRANLPALPLVGVLVAAHATGQIVGMLAGAGGSPGELD
jgi:hypothetical protein